MSRWGRIGGALALAATSVVVAASGSSSPAGAQAPGGGPWVVSMGDSYISGEAGRWAGNSNDASWRVDAGGPGAYLDGGTFETTPGCHRSTAAEIHIGGGVNSLNLACSGARTSTTTSSDGSFKPGIDFYDGGPGRQGQARVLQDFAAANDVEMIQLSIGGNDFGFASIVQTCVTNFLLSPSWWPNYCYDDSSVRAQFTSARIAANTAAILGSITNIRTAMANAGYAPTDYTIVVQTYPSPIPRGSGFRYSQSGYTRQSTGGCGFWSRDADWANDTALVHINGAVRNAVAQAGAGVVVMDVTGAFNGRRLCETGVNLVEKAGLTSWTSPGAVDRTEWIAQIRTVTTVFGPYQIQESLHPNWWGQLALRNCVRQAWNGGSPRGGTCVRGTGLNALAEPNMTLL